MELQLWALAFTLLPWPERRKAEVWARVQAGETPALSAAERQQREELGRALPRLRAQAEARGARIRAVLCGVTALAPATRRPAERSRVLAETAACITPSVPDAWIGGSSGHPVLDEVEAPLLPMLKRWPQPKYPKTIWGEFCGSGGQLLAAALLEPGRRVLVTAPTSYGPQYAAMLEKP